MVVDCWSKLFCFLSRLIRDADNSCGSSISISDGMNDDGRFPCSCQDDVVVVVVAVVDDGDVNWIHGRL